VVFSVHPAQRHVITAALFGILKPSQLKTLPNTLLERPMHCQGNTVKWVSQQVLPSTFPISLQFWLGESRGDNCKSNSTYWTIGAPTNPHVCSKPADNIGRQAKCQVMLPGHHIVAPAPTVAGSEPSGQLTWSAE